MILTKEVEMRVNSRVLKHFRNFGYDVNMNDYIKVDVNHLNKGSHSIILVECDICKKQNNIQYRTYKKQFDKSNMFCCSDCKIIKINQTKLKKYGVYYYNNREKYKVTYSNKTTIELEIAKKKKKETTLKKYGVEHQSQNEEIHNKQCKSGLNAKLYRNIRYQGSYEFDFLEKYYSLRIEKLKPIFFTFNGKKSVYYPDFYFKPLNLIIEIKSNYFYHKYLEKNLEKQKACLEQGYNFIFIINKNYDEFNELIKTSYL